RRHSLTPQQLFAWRRLARRSALLPPPMFVPAVVETSGPEAPPARAPRQARRRSKADGIELEIAGVEVRHGPLRAKRSRDQDRPESWSSWLRHKLRTVTAAKSVRTQPCRPLPR